MEKKLLILLNPIFALEIFFSGKALVFILLSFFIIPSVAKAQDQNAKTDHTQNSIYVSGGAKVYGEFYFSESKVLVAPAKPKKIAQKKAVKSNIAAQIKTKKEGNKQIVKTFAKKVKSNFFLSGAPADQDFKTTSNSGNTDYLLPLQSFSKNLVSHHYTILEVPVFYYLLKIYTADFSKTALLSHFLFSRPPPQLF